MSLTLQSPLSPVLISGVYRSGSTYANALISCFEGYKSLSSALKYLRFCDSMEELQLSNLRQFVEDTCLRLSKRWKIELDSNLIIQNIHNIGVCHSTAYHIFMCHILNDMETQWCDKLVLGWDKTNRFLTFYPHGIVLHIVRNPVDVMLSYKNMTNEPNPIYLDSIFNCFSSFLFLDNCKEISNRICPLRVEDLRDPSPDVIDKLASYIPSSFNYDKFNKKQFSTLVDDWKTNTTIDRYAIPLKSQNTWLSQIEKCTDFELFLIKTICGDFLTKYGYPLTTSTKQYSTKYIHDKLSFPYLIDRYESCAAGLDPGPSYYSDPISYELSLIKS